MAVGWIVFYSSAEARWSVFDVDSFQRPGRGVRTSC